LLSLFPSLCGVRPCPPHHFIPSLIVLPVGLSPPSSSPHLISPSFVLPAPQSLAPRIHPMSSCSQQWFVGLQWSWSWVLSVEHRPWSIILGGAWWVCHPLCTATVSALFQACLLWGAILGAVLGVAYGASPWLHLPECVAWVHYPGGGWSCSCLPWLLSTSSLCLSPSLSMSLSPSWSSPSWLLSLCLVSCGQSL
jgi:hypothetical protein